MRKIFLVLIFSASPLLAGVPGKITYQGRLSQAGLAASGSHTFQGCFKTGGGPICAPVKSLTLPPSGDFTFVIDVPAGVDFVGSSVQLEVSVDGNLLSPADDFVSVPYALVASSATSLTGNLSSSQVQLNGTGALLSSWQSSTTPTMIDASKIVGSIAGQWTPGTGGVLSYSGGNVGIGTTTPGAKLDVQGGPIKASGGLIIENRTSDPASPATGQIWLRTDLP